MVELLGKKIADITEEDLAQLISDEVSEGKAIDYKQELPGDTSEEKREFLVDLSSLANTIGGSILYGIQEEQGLPVSLSGVEIEDFDLTKQRLENLVRIGLDPRLPELSIHEVQLSDGGFVVVVSTNRSHIGPHRVTVRGHDKFYARNSVGKYPLDVGELRRAFTRQMTYVQRIREFRRQRLAEIDSQETAIPLEAQAKTVLHIIPLIPSDEPDMFDLRTLWDKSEGLLPLSGGSCGRSACLEGLVSYGTSGRGTDQRINSFVLLAKQGWLEVVDGCILAKEHNNERFLASYVFEESLIGRTAMYLKLLERIGVDPPLYLMLSLLGVKGYVLAGKNISRGRINRSEILAPEVVLDSYSCDVDVLLKPAIDTVWNSAGFLESQNFGSDGRWHPH